MKLFTKFYLSILFSFWGIVSAWSADKNAPIPNLVLAKDNPVVSERLRTLIAPKNPDEMIKVWVYFTDKGIFDESLYKFSLQERKQALLVKTLKRRAKLKEKEVIDFYDLPVLSSYIEQVNQLGAKLNHVSRWLNAASFYVPVGKIEAINNLGFVKSVKPVEVLIRQPEPIEESQNEAGPIKTLGGTALNYGPSLNQLQLLNIPAAHSLGFKGQGVLVCMMDTGFRKDHPVFQTAYNEGRVLDEYDFINHDANVQDDTLQDAAGQHSHGTACWSALGGESDGNLYGPAFKANFILAKTEYVPTETRIEEDNWVAGAEWADSLGADIISSSLGYYDFPQNPDTFTYTYADLNGDSAVTTVAADVAASKGILVCNANGNSGPAVGSLVTPADADSIMACGAVNSTGMIATFSSRGPTFDGRIKPELCAQGVSTYVAIASNSSYGPGSGTSFATPLIGGCAAVLLSARPNLNNMQIREAMMQSANNAGFPSNSYGWGMPDMLLALRYSFINGDVNTDNNINLADIIFLVNYTFKGGLAPHPLKVGDVNCDSGVGLTDIVYLVNFVFKGGPSPC